MGNSANLVARFYRLCRSFQGKLLLTLLLPQIVIWVIVLAVSAASTKRQENVFGDQQVLNTRLQAEELNDKVDIRLAILEAIAADLDATKLTTPRYANSVLSQRPALRVLFSEGAVIYALDGTAIADHPTVKGRAGNNFADRDYLQQLFATGKAVVSLPYTEPFLKVLQLSMCVPIKGTEDHIKGALCGVVGMQSDAFIGHLSDEKTMGNYEFYLLAARDRTIVASTDPSRVRSTLPANPLLTSLLEGHGKRLVAKASDGIEKLYFSAPVEAAGWMLVIALRTEIAYAPALAMQSDLQNVAALASLVVMLTSIYMARRAIQPLQIASDKMDAMSSGREPLQHVAEAGDSEIRSLLISFNRLSDSVITQTTQLKDEGRALKRVEDELREFNQNLEHLVADRTRELEQANDELHEQQEFISKVTDTVPCLIGYWDRGLRCRFANKVYEKWFNVDVGTIVGMHIKDVLGERLFQQNLQLINATLGGERQSFQRETRLVDGSVGYMATTYIPDVNNGSIKGFFVLAEDITEIKCAENRLRQLNDELEVQVRAATQASVEKSEFLANMSHEIRTPMNVILGLSYALQKSELSSDAQHMVGEIRGAGRLLLGILNDVLDFSKIESGMLEVQTEPFQLNDVLSNIASIMAANAQQKDLELVIAPATQGGRLLLGDSLRLEQVLINLTGNAIKFTERGYVALAIDVEQHTKDQVTLRFAVRDSGIGIHKDKQQMIFAAFSQADGSTSRKFGGSGLGLAISRRLVSAMGGELNVTSTPGAGSEFWFSLHFDLLAESTRATPEPIKLNVLIADDSPLAREALDTIAHGIGWKSITFDSGNALLQHIKTQEQPPQTQTVLLVDYNMPGKNGLETANAVRHELHHASDTIVILVTAYNSEELQSHPDIGLADAILSKPVTPSALYDAVTKSLQKHGDELTTAVATATHLPRLPDLRMLVVDDSEINLEVARRIFESEGAKVSLADNGQNALEWLSQHDGAVDIVLMDVQMPVMNGYEATQRIRTHAKWKNLPVVALTAGVFVEHQDQALQAGMSGFIAKPFDVDKAVSLIQKLTEQVPTPPLLQTDATEDRPSNTPADLPGIAITRVLQLLHDKTNYQKLLRKFANHYANIVQDLANTNALDVQAMAHKLRGAAASLGLDDVAAAALGLEQALKQTGTTQQPLLGLQKAMAIALDSIARYAPQTPNSTSEGLNAPTPQEREKAQE